MTSETSSRKISKDIITPADEKMAKNYNSVMCPNWFEISVYNFP